MTYTPLTFLSRQISGQSIDGVDGDFDSLGADNAAIATSLTVVSGPTNIAGTIGLLGPCTISGSNYIVLDYDQLPKSDPVEKGRLWIDTNDHLSVSPG